MNLDFRSAEHADLEFIAGAIIEADKSGSEILSYNSIFGLTEPEVKKLIRQIIEEEIEGQEWFLPNFILAIANNRPVACLSSWVEGETGIGSGILKSQAMSYFLGDVWQNSAGLLAKVAGTQLPRLKGALQLENIYTAAEFRGMGIVGQLIARAIKNAKLKHPLLQLAEIQIMANNESALRSYTKCGFLEQARATSADTSVLTLLPSAARISLRREI